MNTESALAWLNQTENQRNRDICTTTANQESKQEDWSQYIQPIPSKINKIRVSENARETIDSLLNSENNCGK